MDDQNPKPSSLAPAKTMANTGNRRKRMMLIAIIAIIVAFAVLWMVKDSQLQVLRTQTAKDNQRLERQAQEAVIRAHEQQLRLLAKPFSWAVRIEMMNNSINQINLYANELVKERNISSIIIVNQAGKIISSTDKKWEGRDFSAVGKQSYLDTDSTIVENIKDSVLMMSSPIMGFNNRLGTLVLTYSLHLPQLVE
jgi:type II secretory pathway pseudopilin PulG